MDGREWNTAALVLVGRGWVCALSYGGWDWGTSRELQALGHARLWCPDMQDALTWCASRGWIASAAGGRVALTESGVARLREALPPSVLATLRSIDTTMGPIPVA